MTIDSRPLRNALWVKFTSLAGLAALIVLLGCSPRFFSISAEQRLAKVEKDINFLYRTDRPFSYRWLGAPYSVQVDKGQQVPAHLLRRAIGDVQRAELSIGRSARSLRMLGRIELLAEDYDRAIEAYHQATLRDPADPNLQLELAIGFSLRARKERRALDYERALEAMLQAGQNSTSPEILFDTALLFDDVPLPQLAIEKWQTVVTSESSPEWLNEARQKLEKAKQFVQVRDQQIHNLTDSASSFLAHEKEAQESVELVVETALGNWLPVAGKSGPEGVAFDHLAQVLKDDYKDEWLRDLLKTSASRNNGSAFRALSESVKENSDGNHIRAAKRAASAERIFRRLNNPAGILRSRLERVYSLDRQRRPKDCMKALSGVRSAAHSRHYVWIEGQSWLEEIACQTETRQTEVIAVRQQAYEWINKTGYEVLRLRALSFMTEDYVSFGSRLWIWKRGREGLVSFWNKPLPTGRGYTFYFTMASSARSAGDERAALVLLREGVYALKKSPYHQLRALVLAYLGTWESQAGLRTEAAQTFHQMEDLFDHLDRTETRIFWREAEMMHAAAEVAAGQPDDAFIRLKRLTLGTVFPYSQFGAIDRRKLLPEFGGAYLASGALDLASKYFQQIVLETQRDSKLVGSRTQRDNARREIESAWRGLAEVDLRKNRLPQALATWAAFRGAKSSPTYQKLNHTNDGTVLLVYAFLPGGLSAWEVDHTGIRQQRLDSKTILQDIDSFCVLAADPESPLAAVQSSARRLYATLIHPFEEHLPANGLLVIDADGPLSRVPWAALEDAQGRALIERFAITQSSEWPENVSHPDHKAVDFRRPLIVGDPTLGAELADQYPVLIESRREAQRLKSKLPQALSLTGGEATLDALTHRISESTMLYFAGHGISHGGFGALLLSPSPNDAKPASLLTADEIAKLQLNHLQLVILAACSSGTGDQAGFVNLDSLVQSFLRAGAFRVVAARWNVSSPDTADLMSRFHDFLLEGQLPAEALRKAALIVRGNEVTVHPYYWAGFQAFGRP